MKAEQFAIVKLKRLKFVNFRFVHLSVWFFMFGFQSFEFGASFLFLRPKNWFFFKQKKVFSFRFEMCSFVARRKKPSTKKNAIYFNWHFHFDSGELKGKNAINFIRFSIRLLSFSPSWLNGSNNVCVIDDKIQLFRISFILLNAVPSHLVPLSSNAKLRCTEKVASVVSFSCVISR